MPAQAQLDPDQFAQKIKAKYPAYAKLPNDELSKKWLAKYPAYWKSIDPAKFAARGMWEPSSAGTHPAGGITPQPTSAGKFMEKAAPIVAEAASPVLSTIGGVAGAAIAGPPGAMVGAATGGAVGEGFRQKLSSEPVSAGKMVGEGEFQGLLEPVGTAASALVKKVGARAIPKVGIALNRYIGLNPSDLPKWGRSADEAQKISDMVLSEAGVKRTLPEQQAAIEAARQAHDQATLALVQSPGGKLSSMHSIAIDRAVKLLDELEKEGVPHEQIQAIDKNLEGITSNLKDHMTPAELLQSKREISNQITDWNVKTTNVRQRFLQGLYTDINDSIAASLPPPEAAQFRAHNLAQTRLIVAREATKEKILGQELKPTPGLATKAFRTVGGAAIGAASGAGYAALSGQPVDMRRDIVIGSLIGAAGGRYSESLRPTTELPALDVKAQQAIAKAAPKLPKAARALPVVVRAIQAIQSRPQNQP